MLDHRDKNDPSEQKKAVRRGDFDQAPGNHGKPSAGSPSEGKDLPKRKGPIVNRKGPSEVDRAIRMSQAMNGRPTGSGRKVAEGSVSRGTVVRIDQAKGYGFLVDSAGEQRFFHRSAVLDGGFAGLKEQQIVEFEARGDERGARAIKVRPSSSSASTSPSKPPTRPQSSPKAPKATGWRSDLMPFRSGTTPPRASKRRP